MLKLLLTLLFSHPTLVVPLKNIGTVTCYHFFRKLYPDFVELLPGAAGRPALEGWIAATDLLQGFKVLPASAFEADPEVLLCLRGWSSILLEQGILFLGKVCSSHEKTPYLVQLALYKPLKHLKAFQNLIDQSMESSAHKPAFLNDAQIIHVSKMFFSSF